MALKRFLIIFFVFSTLSCFGIPFEEPWGKDTALLQTSYQSRNQERKEESAASQIAHQVIRFHQRFLSPTTGPRSSYRPSSSEYMKQSIQKFGFLKGYLKGCDRLLRENNEEWVYPTVTADGTTYKYDPAKK